MADVYLSNGSGDAEESDFYLADMPLLEVAGRLRFKPEDREPWLLKANDAGGPLFVVVAVRKDEVNGTDFAPGFYRPDVTPLQAMKECGVRFSTILGDFKLPAL